MRILSNDIAVLDGDTHLGKWVQECGRLDCDRIVDTLVQYVSPGGTVVDAGAYIGDHTIAYCRAADKVLAFEPNPRAFECLKHNLRHEHNVLLRNVALSDHRGNGNLREVFGNFGASYLTNEPANEVALETLDSYSAGFERFDLFKIDVEGHEIEVLNGARELLKHFHPVLYIEINDGALRRNGHNANELIGHLVSLGYQVEPIFFDCPQWDAICIPRRAA